MNNYIKIFHIFIGFFDYFTSKKICNFLKTQLNNKKIILFDVGAHKGETIELFLKNFLIDRIYSFEANKEVYKILKKKDDFNIFTYNFGVGEEETTKDFNTVVDSQSSTFAEIANDSKYFLIKKKILQPFSKKEYSYKQSVKIRKLSNFIEGEKLDNIDVLKIDTEGYEFNVLRGISEGDFKKIKFILLEHHYDDMIKKDYKYGDISDLLKLNNFKLVFKSKMYFRKTFEYIFENIK
jgi:FkbM family methyltransferase